VETVVLRAFEFVFAMVFGTVTARFCTDRWTGLVAVTVALVVIADAVLLPGAANVLMLSLMALVLLPSALAAKVSPQIRGLLPAAIFSLITTGAALYAPPRGLRAAVLLAATAAALAAVAWRLMRTRRYH